MAQSEVISDLASSSATAQGTSSKAHSSGSQPRCMERQRSDAGCCCDCELRSRADRPEVARAALSEQAKELHLIEERAHGILGPLGQVRPWI